MFRDAYPMESPIDTPEKSKKPAFEVIVYSPMSGSLATCERVMFNSLSVLH